MASTGELIRSARPAFIVRGTEESSLNAGLLRLSIVENVEGLYRCEAAFGNFGNRSGSAGYLFFDRSVLDFGIPFHVKTNGEYLFKGRIMAIEAQYPEGKPPEIVVLAEDRLQDMRMTRRTRTFENMNDSAIFNLIAQGHGCTSQVDIADDLTHKVIAQVNQSDLAFMRERARSIDAELWIDDMDIHIQSHSRRSSQPFTLTYQNKLFEFSVIADLANQYSKVKISGWDKSAKSALSHTATESVIASEVGTGKSGASILSSSIREKTLTIAHTFPENLQEAKVEAESAYKAMARRFVVGRGITETDPALKAGGMVDLGGLGSMFDGKYYIYEVRHFFGSENGLRTEITVNRPFIE